MKPGTLTYLAMLAAALGNPGLIEAGDLAFAKRRDLLRRRPLQTMVSSTFIDQKYFICEQVFPARASHSRCGSS